MDIDLLLDIQ